MCGAVNERLLNEAVGLRRASGQVRLLTIDALSALTGLAEPGTLTHDQVVSVLRPASALADTTVALLHSRPKRR